MNYLEKLQELGYTEPGALAIYDFLKCRPDIIEQVLFVNQEAMKTRCE